MWCAPAARPRGMMFIDGLLGLAPDDPVVALRAERAEIKRHAEGAYRALVLAEAPGGLSPMERAACAAAAARLEGSAGLAAAYDRLPAGGRLDLLLPYVERVVVRPGSIDQAAIDLLVAGGLCALDVVAVTQLAAFVPFQVRVLAGLRAMAGVVEGRPAMVVAAPAGYTMAEVRWEPRVAPVEEATATAAQIAALDACPPAVSRSVYFRTLALDPGSLAERGALFDRVMYAPRGLKRVERELATAVVSMVNGCVYCTSVHARRFAELSGEAGVMQRLLDEGFGAPLDARRRAIVDFSAKLTGEPGAMGGSDFDALRAAGLMPLELLDLVHAVAMFANANRLMMALGRSER